MVFLFLVTYQAGKISRYLKCLFCKQDGLHTPGCAANLNTHISGGKFKKTLKNPNKTLHKWKTNQLVKFLLMDSIFAFPWQSAPKSSSWSFMEMGQEMGNLSQAREAILNRNKAKQPHFEIKEIISDLFFHCIEPKELGVFRVNKMHLHFEIQCLMPNFHHFLVVRPLNNAAKKVSFAPDIRSWAGRWKGSGILCFLRVWQVNKWIYV